MKKLILLFLFLTGILQAATIGVDKANYQTNEQIKVTVSGMSVDAKDWIGIYPKGSSNDWENVIDWTWNGAVSNKTHTFNALEAGEYEARAFFHNSFNLEAEVAFTVSGGQAVDTTVTTSKANYEADEQIRITVGGMSGDDQDWIGIYPKGSSNDWNNVIDWTWNGGDADKTHRFKALASGEYEVRVFFHNSFNLEAKASFSVSGGQAVETTVTSSKDTYLVNEQIEITVGGMSGDDQDWIGIYPKGSSNDWNNVIDWTWNGGDADKTHTFNALAVGEYEVRVFFHNSFNLEVQQTFKVEGNPNLPPMIYEDAEDRKTDGWSVLDGSKTLKNRRLNGNRVIYVPHDWRDEFGNDNIPNNWEYNGRTYTNYSLYELTKSNGSYWRNSSQKILQLDVHPYFNWGGSSCFEFGVRVQTLQGERVMYMSTWFGRQNFQPTKTEYEQVVELVYPITKNLVYSNRKQHVKIDLNQKLKMLEPKNRIIRVDSFIMTGGNNTVDNIKLTSH